METFLQRGFLSTFLYPSHLWVGSLWVGKEGGAPSSSRDLATSIYTVNNILGILLKPPPSPQTLNLNCARVPIFHLKSDCQSKFSINRGTFSTFKRRMCQFHATHAGPCMAPYQPFPQLSDISKTLHYPLPRPTLSLVRPQFRKFYWKLSTDKISAPHPFCTPYILLDNFVGVWRVHLIRGIL